MSKKSEFFNEVSGGKIEDILESKFIPHVKNKSLNEFDDIKVDINLIPAAYEDHSYTGETVKHIQGKVKKLRNNFNAQVLPDYEAVIDKRKNIIEP